MSDKEQIYSISRGKSKTIDEWSKESGISKSTLLYRLNRGMTIDEAIDKGDSTTNINSDPDNKYGMDLTGRKFGKLTVIKRCDTKREGEREWRWVCECDCPDHTIVEIIQHNLLNGHSNNCGCSNKNKPKDMRGMKCGHLTVLEEVKDKSEAPENMRKLGVLWRCECDCPEHNIVIIPGSYLRTRKNLSCGCQSKNRVDGESKTKIYIVYKDMIQRCTNPNDPAYKDYLGRGITVCEEWSPKIVNGRNVGYFKFKEWALTHGYSEGLTLDRIDNDSGYSPDNCRFTTMKVQNNNRRSNSNVKYKDITKTCTEMAEYFGINPITFRYRLYSGMTVEEAIETPIRTPLTITTSFGETRTISDWSEISGINSNTIRNRVFHLGWNADIALTTGATNPEIYDHIPYGFNPSYYNPANPGYIPVYTDILGRNYTPEEWYKHQAVFFEKIDE